MDKGEDAASSSFMIFFVFVFFAISFLPRFHALIFRAVPGTMPIHTGDNVNNDFPCSGAPVLLLFAIKMATLPFWAQIKNLRTRPGKAYKCVNSGQNNMILSNLERYNVGLPEYVKIMGNIYGFQSKQ